VKERRRLSKVWVVSERGDEKPWHTNESWLLVAVCESEADARESFPGDQYKIEEAIYFPAATPKGGA
jgi:hypothetical protein